MFVHSGPVWFQNWSLPLLLCLSWKILQTAITSRLDLRIYKSVLTIATLQDFQNSTFYRIISYILYATSGVQVYRSFLQRSFHQIHCPSSLHEKKNQIIKRKRSTTLHFLSTLSTFAKNVRTYYVIWPRLLSTVDLNDPKCKKIRSTAS